MAARASKGLIIHNTDRRKNIKINEGIEKIITNRDIKILDSVIEILFLFSFIAITFFFII